MFSDLPVTKFFPIFRVSWWFGSTKLMISVQSWIPNHQHHQHTLKMGTELVPETSAKLHILTRLSPQDNFIELCRRKSFKTFFMQCL